MPWATSVAVKSSARDPERSGDWDNCSGSSVKGEYADAIGE